VFPLWGCAVLKPGECRIEYDPDRPYPWALWLYDEWDGERGGVRCRTFCAAKRYATINGYRIVEVPVPPDG
jgi:hypothetical protein